MNGFSTRNCWRVLACAAVGLTLWWSGFTEITNAAEVSLRADSQVPDWSKVDWNDWENVESLLENIREVSGIPAIAAAIVKDGRIVDVATVGVREVDTQEGVKSDDRFHIGSVTKSMTATVIGKLVEEGKLSWSTTVSNALSQMPMRDTYRNVTIEQLLHHQGAIPAYTSSEPYRKLAHGKYSGTPTEQRAAFLEKVLGLEAAGIPGQVTLYANAGYALAGHMAERVTGRSWEDLISHYIFVPSSMNSSGFGHPGTALIPDQPRGHGVANGTFVPLDDHEHPPMHIIAPAGNVHCSIADLAKYLISHLKGLNGHDGELRSETIKRLHTLPARHSELQYASGWIINTDRNGETIHRHGGTTGSFYAEIKLFPEKRAGVAVLLNVPQSAGELVANKVGRALMARYSADRGAVTKKKLTASGQMQFETLGSKEGEGVDGGEWKSQESSGIEIKMGDPATPEEDARIWNVLKRMAESLNDEDKKAFLSLFAVNDVGQKSSFMFMAGQVLPRRGGIRSFHELSQPMELPDSKYPIRTVIYHLENGSPGYFGISLNEEGKIDHFSLFVKSDMCPNGPDTQCDMNVRTLGKDL